MTAQSGHVKSVRSTTDVSHDGRPNLPDVGPPGGVSPQRHETQTARKPHTCSLQATDFYFVVPLRPLFCGLDVKESSLV